jgi:hypothetical protein
MATQTSGKVALVEITGNHDEPHVLMVEVTLSDKDTITITDKPGERISGSVRTKAKELIELIKGELRNGST